MEINFLNNFMKLSSVTQKGKVILTKNEALRENDFYHNNVNAKLSHRNINIVPFNEDVLNRQFFDTEVDARARDVVTVVSRINTQNISEVIGKDLTFFLSEKEWEEYFKANYEYIQDKLGENAHCVYSVVHMDEGVPHLQSMFVLHKEQSREVLKTEKDIDMAKVEKALKMDFLRFKKKNGITAKNFKEFTNGEFKTFREFQNDYYEKKRPEKIKFQLKKLNEKTVTKPCVFPSSARSRVDYKTFNTHYVEVAKENDSFKRFKSNIEWALNQKEKVEVVNKMQKGLVKSTNLGQIKEEMRSTKNRLLKQFLGDPNDENARGELTNFLIKEMIQERRLKMSAEDFDSEMRETQQILNKKDRFNIEKFSTEKALEMKQVYERVMNYAKAVVTKPEELRKAEKFIKGYTKKYSKIEAENEFAEKWQKAENELETLTEKSQRLDKVKNSKEKKLEGVEKELEISEEKLKMVTAGLEAKVAQLEKFSLKVKEKKGEVEKLEGKILAIKKADPEFAEKIKEKATNELKTEFMEDKELLKQARISAVDELAEGFKGDEGIKQEAKSKALDELKETEKVSLTRALRKRQEELKESIKSLESKEKYAKTKEFKAEMRKEIVTQMGDEDKVKLVKESLDSFDGLEKRRFYRSLLSQEMIRKNFASSEDYKKVEDEAKEEIKENTQAVIFSAFNYIFRDLEEKYRRFVERALDKEYYGTEYETAYRNAMSINVTDDDGEPILFRFFVKVVDKIKIFFAGKKELKEEITKDIETLKNSTVESVERKKEFERKPRMW
jgi:hypothetical protein